MRVQEVDTPGSAITVVFTGPFSFNSVLVAKEVRFYTILGIDCLGLQLYLFIHRVAIKLVALNCVIRL